MSDNHTGRRPVTRSQTAAQRAGAAGGSSAGASGPPLLLAAPPSPPGSPILPRTRRRTTEDGLGPEGAMWSDGRRTREELDRKQILLNFKDAEVTAHKNNADDLQQRLVRAEDDLRKLRKEAEQSQGQNVELTEAVRRADVDVQTLRNQLTEKTRNHQVTAEELEALKFELQEAKEALNIQAQDAHQRITATADELAALKLSEAAAQQRAANAEAAPQARPIRRDAFTTMKEATLEAAKLNDAEKYNVATQGTIALYRASHMFDRMPTTPLEFTPEEDRNMALNALGLTTQPPVNVNAWPRPPSNPGSLEERISGLEGPSAPGPSAPGPSAPGPSAPRPSATPDRKTLEEEMRRFHAARNFPDPSAPGPSGTPPPA